VCTGVLVYFRGSKKKRPLRFSYLFIFETNEIQFVQLRESLA